MLLLFSVAAGAGTSAPLAANARAAEREALRRAKDDYKTQLRFEGQYGAPETTDLRRQYEEERARIEKKYNKAPEEQPAGPSTELLVQAPDAPDAQKAREMERE